LRKEKPELARRSGLKRLALFGSYAREKRREDSDVDILVEIEPEVGLRFARSRTALRKPLESVPKLLPAGQSNRVIEIIKEDLVDVP